jgi:osmotically-inducible protein OsmY
MRNPRLLCALVLLVIALPLGGCGLVVGAGAATGLAAMDERGVEGVARDSKISADISTQLFSKDTSTWAKLGVEVYQGRVLLTGATENQAAHAEAVRTAWATDGVKDVIDEIQDTPIGLFDTTRDTTITSELLTKMTFDKLVYTVNYKVETVGGVVYLLGTAQNQAELDRVLGYARDISYVKSVKSHVRVKGTA